MVIVEETKTDKKAKKRTKSKKAIAVAGTINIDTDIISRERVDLSFLSTRYKNPEEAAGSVK